MSVSISANRGTSYGEPICYLSIRAACCSQATPEVCKAVDINQPGAPNFSGKSRWKEAGAI